MSPPITEQASSSLQSANIREARDLDSQRASSFLDADSALNTDRELWRERPDDYYADSIHVTESGGIGINVGGHVLVATLKQWHDAGKKASVVNLETQPPELKSMLFAAYFAGFQLSSRNWNAEYPGTVTQDDIKDDFDAWFPIARFPTSQVAAEQASLTLLPGRGFLRT